MISNKKGKTVQIRWLLINCNLHCICKANWFVLIVKTKDVNVEQGDGGKQQLENIVIRNCVSGEKLRLAPFQ